LLGGDSDLKIETAADGFTIKLPSTPMNAIASVIKVEL
jgi:hypothetical protein